MYHEQDLRTVQEVVEGVVPRDLLQRKLESGECVALRGRRGTVVVGEGVLVKVSVQIGANLVTELDDEVRKISAIEATGYGPDLMMDLSTTRLPIPLHTIISETLGCPVGTLPHYLCFNRGRGFNERELLKEVEVHARSGVSFMTLHLTPTRDLYELARATRHTPMTARGGGLVLEDMYVNGRSEGVFLSILDEVLEILHESGVVLSLGTTFRPANVLDALDEVHLKEIEAQARLVPRIRRAGVPVMMEGVGHITLDKILQYIQLTKRKIGIPLMPLGPVPTDAAVGFDHVSNAIGGSFMAFHGGADILNSMTREEHTGGVPSQESILEGLRTARIAAHAVNIARFGDSLSERDRQVDMRRAKNYTCVVDGGIFTKSAQERFKMGCTRCGTECPLLVNFRLSHDFAPNSKTS